MKHLVRVNTAFLIDSVNMKKLIEVFEGAYGVDSSWSKDNTKLTPFTYEASAWTDEDLEDLKKAALLDLPLGEYLDAKRKSAESLLESETVSPQ